MIQEVKGNVCAPRGFTASGIHCGIRANTTKKDLALICSEKKANTACVYTTNLVKAAPIAVTKGNLQDGQAQAIICNSGNANACNANGVEIAHQMCALTGKALNIDAKDVVVASTGVIGKELDIAPIANNIQTLVDALSADGMSAAQAIMTTDTLPKEIAVRFELGGKTCTIGGIAKGSGMIHPNMATMLAFLTTDVAISSAMLSKALSADVQDTFNMISVDGDTSTNDMLCIMANGLAGNAEITEENEDYALFAQALRQVNTYLAKMIAKDGEGATKLLACTVTGAPNQETARIVAKSVICSSLVKAAMFGADANWGRILCAIGYSGADVDVTKIDVAFQSEKGTIDVCQNGASIPFSEGKAKKILLEKEIDILIDLNSGEAKATSWGCDLTYDYVKINGDYRS